ncbi:MAG: M28 family peptidase [Acidobacteriota bacterium]
MIRSLLRIFSTVVGILALAWLMIFWLVRQPMRAAPRRIERHADPRRLRDDVQVLARDLVPRDVAHPENLDRAALYIARQFELAGLAPEFERYEARGGKYANVVARIGSGRSPLVIGAHYDAFGEFGANPGADDNASGVAGLLELARLISGHKIPGGLELVAFSTEEPPFFGSRQMGSAVHADRMLASDRRSRGMVSLEMIGYFTERQPWPSALLRAFYPTRGDFVMLAGRRSDRALIRALKPGFQGGSSVPMVSYAGPFVGGLDASDHVSFWDRGLPAAVLTDTSFLRNPRYHASDDTSGSLDYPRMAAVVDGLANAVLGPVAPP